MPADLNLKVAEAVQDDVNKGIVRIDSSYMKQIAVSTGDIVEIEGERKTVGIVDRAYPGDIGLNIIRMDGIIRRNAKTGVGDIVQVRKIEVKEAKKIILAPARKGVIVKASPNSFKQGLLGRAMVKGDIVALGGTNRRKSTLSSSPFFDDVFSMLDESMTGLGFGDLKFIVVNTTPKQPVIITENTDIELNSEAVEVEEEKVLEVTYEDIGGLNDEITKIREMVELPLKHPEIFERLGIDPPKGVLLHGPPGTGKTLLAKAVANETNSKFFLINGPEIMSKYYGQSEENLRNMFEEAEKDGPSIIFIDEVDAIAPKREESKGEVERRVVAQLLALMDGLKSRGRVVVIAATNIPNAVDPALRRPGRFDREIEIGVPDIDGRLNVLKIHTRNMPLAKNISLKDISNITYGFVGADLAALAKEAAMIVLRKVLPDLKLQEEEAIPVELLEKLKITQKDFKDALKIVRPSAMREVLVEVPNITWNDIGGLDDVKVDLKEAVELPLKSPELFKKLGVRPPRGILLYGPPGTGKTLLAKAVANESDANFILVKGPELLSRWVGESERGIREIFKKARQTAPTIICFDEIDSIAPERGSNGGNPHVIDSSVNQLLTEMSGLEELNDVIVIATTNRPHLVDPALLRPGRFDRIILTPVPDKEARFEIFNVHTKDMPIKVGETVQMGNSESTNKIKSKMASDEPLNEEEIKNIKEKKKINKKDLTDKEKLLYSLAEKTDSYTGSDIEAVCREAAIMALRENLKTQEITLENFEVALKKIYPSLTKEIQKAYDEFKKTISTARGKQITEDKPAYMG